MPDGSMLDGSMPEEPLPEESLPEKTAASRAARPRVGARTARQRFRAQGHLTRPILTIDRADELLCIALRDVASHACANDLPTPQSARSGA
jgi:hypothetical protein